MKFRPNDIFGTMNKNIINKVIDNINNSQKKFKIKLKVFALILSVYYVKILY